jgi:hypothetical protein
MGVKEPATIVLMNGPNSVCLMKLAGVTRTLWIVSRTRGSSRPRRSTSARWVWTAKGVRGMLTGRQVAALKLRQKAISDATPSFQQLVQLGY